VARLVKKNIPGCYVCLGGEEFKGAALTIYAEQDATLRLAFRGDDWVQLRSYVNWDQFAKTLVKLLNKATTAELPLAKAPSSSPVSGLTNPSSTIHNPSSNSSAASPIEPITAQQIITDYLNGKV